MFKERLKIVKPFNKLNALLYVKRYSCLFFSEQICNPGNVILDPKCNLLDFPFHSWQIWNALERHGSLSTPL